jgi:hypothetical protein
MDPILFVETGMHVTHRGFAERHLVADRNSRFAIDRAGHPEGCKITHDEDNQCSKSHRQEHERPTTHSSCQIQYAQKPATVKLPISPTQATILAIILRMKPAPSMVSS